MQQYVLRQSFTPTSWAPMSDEVKLHSLPESSEEFRSIARKVNCTLKEKVKSVVRIQNPFLWGCYQYKKSEYQARGILAREMELFHCTSDSNIHSIASDNLDWRRCSRSLFGQGVSFSPSAEYANKYANYDIGKDRAMILCNVLVGSKTIGSKTMIIPPLSYDTTTGNNEMVYVKYYDYEFYPLYVAHYTCAVIPRPKRRDRQFFYDDDDDLYDLIFGDVY